MTEGGIFPFNLFSPQRCLSVFSGKLKIAGLCPWCSAVPMMYCCAHDAVPMMYCCAHDTMSMMLCCAHDTHCTRDALLCPWCHTVPSLPCHVCEAMPFPWTSVVLAAPRAKEIPPHIKPSWGGLLTWILFSVSWLQLPLLPNYTWPGWFLTQMGEGIRASHSQGRGPQGRSPSNERLGWPISLCLLCRKGIWVLEWEEIPLNVSFLPEGDWPASQFRAQFRERAKTSTVIALFYAEILSPKCPRHNAHLVLKEHIQHLAT